MKVLEERVGGFLVELAQSPLDDLFPFAADDGQN
jgi:hypothetical protein